MRPIAVSVFDLFKIGPGPSSSHTIGPMVAAARFLEALARRPEATARGRGLRVRLYGSLSATGKGHGTDRAVAAGLLGWKPDAVDAALFQTLLRDQGDVREVALPGGRRLPFSASDIVFDRLAHGFPFQNALEFELLGDGAEVLFSRRYYSVGGGFVQEDEREGEPGAAPGAAFPPALGEPVAAPPHPFADAVSLRAVMAAGAASSLELPELMLENEAALTGRSQAEIFAGLSRIVRVMEAAVDAGLAAEGPLPGPIGLRRKAATLNRGAATRRFPADKFLLRLNAYALAASEQNAAGGLVVTAPTSGASGVVPAAVLALKRHFRLPPREVERGLLSAAAVGLIIKTNASISGAEVGCQGEIGAASAMAAALFAQALSAPGRAPLEALTVVLNAAEIALEHHLGMTCDPVGGYVQIPCIERNAMGAVKAYDAYLLASAGDPSRQRVCLDNAVRAMLETGRDMCAKYKETAQGGLAVSLPGC